MFRENVSQIIFFNYENVYIRDDSRAISRLFNWMTTSKCPSAFAIKGVSERHDLTTTSARNATSVSLVARISNENSTELMRSRAAAFKGLNRIGAI